MEDIILILTLLGEAALLYAVISYLSGRLSRREERQEAEDAGEDGDNASKDAKLGRLCLLHGTIVSKGDWSGIRK